MHLAPPTGYNYLVSTDKQSQTELRTRSLRCVNAQNMNSGIIMSSDDEFDRDSVRKSVGVFNWMKTMSGGR